MRQPYILFFKASYLLNSYLNVYLSKIQTYVHIFILSKITILNHQIGFILWYSYFHNHICWQSSDKASEEGWTERFIPEEKPHQCVYPVYSEPRQTSTTAFWTGCLSLRSLSPSWHWYAADVWHTWWRGRAVVGRSTAAWSGKSGCCLLHPTASDDPSPSPAEPWLDGAFVSARSVHYHGWERHDNGRRRGKPPRGQWRRGQPHCPPQAAPILLTRSPSCGWRSLWPPPGTSRCCRPPPPPSCVFQPQRPRSPGRPSVPRISPGWPELGACESPRMHTRWLGLWKCLARQRLCWGPESQGLVQKHRRGKEWINC